jgi:glycine/D-amino acid oxidase-like deaminating enzyme
VAIIGGGFMGVSTARELLQRRPGLGVVLLEARTLGNGATGRNGGQVLNWINGVHPKSPEEIKRVWDTTLHGIDTVLRRADRKGVRWSRNGAMECYTDQKRAEGAHAYVERLQAAGVPVRFVQGDELRRLTRAEGVVGAVFDPTAGVLAGLDLVRAEKPDLLAAGCRIYEETPVTRVEGDGPHVLTTPDGEVRADAIVLATNGYTGLLGWFQDRILPLQSHVVALPMNAGEWGDADAWADDMDRISYAARTPDGHLIFGGGSNHAYGYHFGGRTSSVTTPKARAALDNRLSRYFPGKRVEGAPHVWSGTLGVTMTRGCSIGRKGSVYWGLGWSGHGVTLANLAGEVIADIYIGAGEKWADQPFFGAPLGWIPPEPLRWAGYHIYTTLTGKSPRRAG